MKVDLADLEWFLAIVDCGTFSRAAQALRVSQPSLSRRIAAMERAIGATLFSRERRQIELTAAGRVLAREARGLLGEARAAIDAARGAARGASGTLRIGYRSAFRRRILPRAIAALRAGRPDSALVLSSASVDTMLAGVRSRELDVALYVSSIGVSDLAVDVLRTVPIVVALPDGHRLARREVVDVRNLSREMFVAVSEADVPDYLTVIARLCERAGFAPHVVVTVDSADMKLACVAAGVGITLCFGENDGSIDGVTFRAIRPAGPPIQFQAVYRDANDNPLLHDFVRLLHDASGVAAPRAAPRTARARRR